MSWVVAAPEYVTAAASDLAGIASTIDAANQAALFPTNAVLAAGADEVSAALSALFGAHAQAYQALSAQAASFHQQFVQLMSSGAAQYAAAEALNATPMQLAADAINDPVLALTGRPLFGNGANGVDGTGAPAATAVGCSATAATGGSGWAGPSWGRGRVRGLLRQRRRGWRRWNGG
ncbi:PE family protein [Mycobacterium szulgai]|nr:PE family protein [Mycobacterium szulgai]